MLHRAARNAYSWWWATHIRTKQSKWLEQNLQDMEEKVEYILTIINEDGDSFMMKAEMFFRKRPELVNFIEDCFKGYRALAERYDKLSKDMQNANRTIATVFPEKMQLNDDFDDFPQATSSSCDSERPPVSFPAPPEYISPKKSTSFSGKSLKSPTRLMSKRGLIKLGSTDDAAAEATKKSGLSKSEALVEINRLQKEILALQTEKEFIKSSYESGLAKCLDIENEVTVMQAKVSSLQDEFGIEKVIEDDEARMLMAATALNSCQKKLTTLQDKQVQSIEEAKGQTKKVEKVREKFETMIEQLTKQNSENESVGETKKPEDSDQNVSSIEELSNNMGLVKNSLREQLRVTSDSSLTVSELAEKIDELVDTVLNLESAVSSQSALVNRLRSESDELQEKIQSLEGDKETLTDSSDHKNKKIRDLENELRVLQHFKQSVINENKNSQNQSKVESSKIDNSGDKVQSVESREPTREVPQVNNMMSPKSNSIGESRTDKKVQKDETHGSKPELQSDQRNNHLNFSTKELKMKDNEKKVESLSLTNEGDSQESGVEDHQLNWRELLLNDLEDREKLLLKEYTSLIKNFKQVKQKLSDAEKKHRANLFKSTVQIKVLKTANASKDAEIQSLNKKLNTLQPSDHGLSNTNASTERDSSQVSETSSPNLEQREACGMLRRQEESIESTIESTDAEELNVSTAAEKYNSGELRLAPGISSIEEKIRMDLDELLEENIEFWLRYSTSFHQVQKFQTAFEDLQAELAELNESKKQEGGSTLDKSDVRPIYMHLREIHTELTLWLEQNEVLEDDLQNRSSSITCIQEEISRLSNAGSDAGHHVADETELSDYQAAKFTGEVMNMKQENNKVADELLGGIERVKKLKVEIEVTVAKLDEEFGFSAARNQHAKHSKHKIPLRSFLFGVKLKKQKASLLKCMAPTVNKQPHSDVCEVPPPSR